MRCYFLAFVLGSAAKRAISIMKLGEAALFVRNTSLWILSHLTIRRLAKTDCILDIECFSKYELWRGDSDGWPQHVESTSWFMQSTHVVPFRWTISRCIARNIANSAWAYATTQLPSIWARKDTELLLDVRVLTAVCMDGCLFDGFETSHFFNEVQGVDSPTFALRKNHGEIWFWPISVGMEPPSTVGS